MNQKEIIKQMLVDKEWTCVTKMMAAYIPDYRRRLCDLREDGLILEARPCRQHSHNSRILQEWRIIGNLGFTGEKAEYSTLPPENTNFKANFAKNEGSGANLASQKVLFPYLSEYRH